jgi:hypothetical protein
MTEAQNAQLMTGPFETRLSPFTLALGICGNKTALGTALVEPELLSHFQPGHIFAGLPVLNMDNERVVKAIQQHCDQPPEVTAVRKMIKEFTRPWDEATKADLADMESAGRKDYAAKRNKERNDTVRAMKLYLSMVRGSCSVPGRTWTSTDCIKDPVQTAHGDQVLFPILLQPLQVDNVAAHAAAAAAPAVVGEDELQQEHNSEELSPEQLLRDEAVAQQVQAAMASAKTLLDVFAVDLLSFFEGTLVKTNIQPGRKFASGQHFAWPYVHAVVANNERKALAIFCRETWITALCNAASDERDLQGEKFKMTFRTPKLGVGAYDDLFCNTIVQIMQKKQWAATSSSVLLENALSASSNKQQSLSTLHRCLKIWMSVLFPNPGQSCACQF